MSILFDKRTKAGVKHPFPEHWHVEIDRVLLRRGWTVISDHDAFVQAVCRELEAKFGKAHDQVTAHTIERAAIHQYCHALYDACASRDRHIQERSLREIWDHLYRAGLFKTHDKERAKDSAQLALINVWKHLDQCRDKGSFINWCNLILLNVVREQYRKETKQTGRGKTQRWVRGEIPLAEVGNPGEDLEMGEPGDSDATAEDTPFELAAQGQLHALLRAALRACLKNEPQQAVVIGCFLNDRTFKELAQELDTTPGNVQVMKSRALGKLRRCGDFVRLYEEWLDVSRGSNS